MSSDQVKKKKKRPPGPLRRFGDKLDLIKEARRLTDPFKYHIRIQQGPHSDGLLNSLCDKYGSDKGQSRTEGHPYPWPSHNYADIYAMMFGLNRNAITKVIECGLGTNNPDLASSMGIDGKPGASLRVWRDYFPNAHVIGLDIDKDILIEEERITTYHCDQTDTESIAAFASAAGLQERSIDIIIDDGLHKFHAGQSLFEGLNRYLSDTGIYVIEDVERPDYYLYKSYFADNTDLPFDVRFITLHRPKILTGGNRMIVLTRRGF